jgi:hypothetical protein
VFFVRNAWRGALAAALEALERSKIKKTGLMCKRKNQTRKEKPNPRV